MPKELDERQRRMAEAASSYMAPGQVAQVGAQDEQQPDMSGAAPVQPPLQARVKDPNINYDNISQGRAVVGRIDSPEYKSVEADVNKYSNYLGTLKPDSPKYQDVSNQLAAKKAALQKIRMGQ